MAKGQSLQDPFLNALRKEHVPVSIYLVNGIKLQGQIDSFDHACVRYDASFRRRFGDGTFFDSQSDGACRHHGGDGVLVNHLAHTISEQDDELVERVDLTLKFDPVHEIN